MAKPHRTLALLLLAAPAWATIWPDQIGAAKRRSVKPVTVADQKLWSEYGLQEAESAQYDKFTATGYRMQDSTGALGAFDWQRPKDAKQSQSGDLAVETPDEAMIANGNYLLVFKGYKPSPAELEALYQALPQFDSSPLPPLRGFLPTDHRIPESERYVVGPAGLEQFDPAIPASAAGFHLGSEAQIGSFQAPGGPLKLAIFSYPTPNIARERLEEMQKLPGAIAKRSGPLVAVILAAPSANDAEWLLSLVRYQAAISWEQRVPTRRDNIGDLIINAFILIGVLLAFSTVIGLAFGGLRGWRQHGKKDLADTLTTLHLGDR
jgi:hypothetical protein